MVLLLTNERFEVIFKITPVLYGEIQIGGEQLTTQTQKKEAIARALQKCSGYLANSPTRGTSSVH